MINLMTKTVKKVLDRIFTSFLKEEAKILICCYHIYGYALENMLF